MPESAQLFTSGSFALAHPLDEFYARTGGQLPVLKRVPAEHIPQPYRSLLVHQNDMTSTLENFHGCSIHLHVVSRERRNGEYFREVVLQLDGNDKPVEFGAIKINLHLFPAAAQQRILEERYPLGHILKDGAIEYKSRPQAFFRVASDALINGLLNLRESTNLFGRRNTLLDQQGRSLAEIVEILPPEPAP
jgi:chorismate-pyruvate lyase